MTALYCFFRYLTNAAYRSIIQTKFTVLRYMGVHMFARLFSRISRLPWFVQIFALPAAAIAYVVVEIGKVLIDIIAWVGKELFASAKSKAKSTLRPLLLPIVALAVLFFLYSVLSQDAMVFLMQNTLLPLVAIVALFFMIKAALPKKSAKKKK